MKIDNYFRAENIAVDQLDPRADVPPVESTEEFGIETKPQSNTSRLERVELGTDVDGDPITSLVVRPAERSPTARNVTRKLSDRQRLALVALDECAAAKGTPAPTELQLPARTIVVQLNAWREELYRKGVLDRDAKSPREEFKRVRQQLQARSLIGVNGELVWKA
jgi:hypothetical protein